MIYKLFKDHSDFKYLSNRNSSFSFSSNGHGKKIITGLITSGVVMVCFFKKKSYIVISCISNTCIINGLSCTIRNNKLKPSIVVAACCCWTHCRGYSTSI